MKEAMFYQHGQGGENSYCPVCSTEMISRFGFSIRRNSLIDGRCSKCGEQIEGVWN